MTAVAVQPGLDPAQRLRHVRGPAHGQRPGHFQVGVGAGGGAAEHLEDGGLAEHHAGVALLAGQHQALLAGVDLGARLVREAQQPGPAAVGDGLQQPPGQVRVVQRVVGHPAVVGHPDHDVLEVVGQFVAQAQEELVGVHRAARGAGAAQGAGAAERAQGARGEGAALRDRHDEVMQPRIAADQLGVGDDSQVEDPGALASEPALTRHPLRQRFLKCHISGLPRPQGSCSIGRSSSRQIPPRKRAGPAGVARPSPG